MPHIPDNAILGVTRTAIYIFMALIIFALVIVGIGAAAVPFKWEAIQAQIALENKGIGTAGLMPAIYAIFVMVALLLLLGYQILGGLLKIIATVADGNPFIAKNARRLKSIGWKMVACQILTILAGAIATYILWDADSRGGVDEFSLNGVFATLLVFVLAGVFEHGAAMREELEGTV